MRSPGSRGTGLWPGDRIAGSSSGCSDTGCGAVLKFAGQRRRLQVALANHTRAGERLPAVANRACLRKRTDRPVLDPSAFQIGLPR
jgi:hypothetical protein